MYRPPYGRYRSPVSEYRQGQRKKSLYDQILLYKQRCEQMKLATNIGVISAIILISTLITGALYTVFRQAKLLKYVSKETGRGEPQVGPKTPQRRRNSVGAVAEGQWHPSQRYQYAMARLACRAQNVIESGSNVYYHIWLVTCCMWVRLCRPSFRDALPGFAVQSKRK